MSNRQSPKSPLVHVSLDLRVTAEDLAPLTPSQITALFESIGKLAALQHGSGTHQAPGDPRASSPEGN